MNRMILDYGQFYQIVIMSYLENWC
jgi:hypothetical protein